MVISRRQADTIIHNLRSVVHEDINIISNEGIIVSSTDTSRVGDTHAGARMVVETKKPLEIEYDGQYEGALRGINLPVFYEGDLVAVVGITGEVDTIRQFSKVIVTMSEILIKEHFLNRQKEFKRENNRVIMELITKDKFNPDVVKMKMDELGYDNVDYYHFAVCELSNFDQHNIDLANRIYNSFEKRLHMYDLLARKESKYLLLSQTPKRQTLIEDLHKIKQYIENKYKVEFTIGISEKITAFDNMYTAYQQANMIVDLDIHNGQGNIVAFDASSLDFFFQAIPDYLRQEFARNVLNGLDAEEIQRMRELIREYVTHNGSLSACAKALYIHKNTLQYRLNRIASISGYNPRNLKDLIVLYVALSLQR